VRLFETEVHGAPMLQRLCDAIYGADGAKAAAGTVAAQQQEVGANAG
jgi:hypothetical protein